MKGFVVWRGREITFFILIAIFFLVLRLPVVHAPYHQDEYKWPMYANPALVAPGMVPHPPLTEFIYKWTRILWGDDNFRLTPLLFSLANLGLIYLIVRRRYGEEVAKWTAVFFSISFFGLLASVTVDTDGAILPFFFLLSLWFYDSFRLSPSGDSRKIVWASLTGLTMLLGVMVKMSFILPIGAIILDYIIDHRRNFNLKKIGWFLLGCLGSVVLLGLILYLCQFIFPGFSLSRGVKYWETFARGFGRRNFFQTGIQLSKSLMYLSPLLILALFVAAKKHFGDLKIFYLFLFLGWFFYLLLFDFSIGALDRYLAFMVIPSCIVAGYVWARGREEWLSGINKRSFAFATVVTAVIFGLQFLPHVTVPLHPKGEWLSRIIFGPWNFLFPFSGGSGPLTFYVSWLFIAVCWLSFALISIGLLYLPKKRQSLILFLLILGLVYNAVFIEEFAWGKINGSARQLVYRSSQFIKLNPEIKQVIVYNDNGAYEIKKIGKYYRRLYAVPGFEETYKKVFANFTGHVLVIDAPIIYPNSLYTEYLSKCKIVYGDQSGKITAKIYECHPQKNG